MRNSNDSLYIKLLGNDIGNSFINMKIKKRVIIREDLNKVNEYDLYNDEKNDKKMENYITNINRLYYTGRCLTYIDRTRDNKIRIIRM